MKYSGVKWIGDIPETWNIIKVKECFYISKEKAHQESPVILSLARSGIKVRDISTNKGQIAESYEDYNPVIPGDLLLNPMDLYSGANCNVSKVSGVISSAYINLRQKVELNPKFFDYFFKTQYWSMAMFAHGKGVSFDNRWTMNAETVLNYFLPYPSYFEQNKIVEFLNKKCNEIDMLISIENKHIEQLNEYKKSIITEAVITGFDKSSTLKASGIDWIGKIPENWQISKLKYIASYNDESIKNDFDSKKTIEYVDIGSVSLENGIEQTEMFEFKDAPSRARRITKKGDIIVSTVRTYLKAIASIDRDGLIVSTGFCVIRPNEKMNRKYVEFYCKSNIFTNEVSKNSNGISYPAINSSTLMNFEITMPPICIQNEIVEKLEKIISSIDGLLNVKQNKIEELNEYKKSIIYEYITGKRTL